METTRVQSSEHPEGTDAATEGLRMLLQAREFALIAAFRERYGAEALEIAKKSNYDAGRRAGLAALSKHPIDPSSVRAAADLYALTTRGMPAADVDERRVLYRNGGPCGYWKVWREAGLSLAEGCQCGSPWGEGFFQAINPRFRKIRTSWRPGGDRYCEEGYELTEE